MAIAAEDIEQGRLVASARVEKSKALMRQVEQAQGGRDEGSNEWEVFDISDDKGPLFNG